MLITGRTLFAFVDPKDPFMPSEVAEETQTGPILSLMAARQFEFLFLFYTPHMGREAEATRHEVERLYSNCKVRMHELPVSDPKDCSAIMGRLAREVRGITQLLPDADNSVCVSSGTAEMRAAWFLLAAVGALPARLLQVVTPADPLFGAANVKEVRLDTSDWEYLRDLMMPQEYFLGVQEAHHSAEAALDSARWHLEAFGRIAERISALAAEILLTEPPPSTTGLNKARPQARPVTDDTRGGELWQEFFSIVGDAQSLAQEAIAMTRRSAAASGDTRIHESQSRTGPNAAAANTADRSAPQGTMLTNADIVQMQKARLSEEIILNKIGTSTTNFDTGAQDLIQLKEAGVTDNVINAIVQRSGRR